MITWRVIFNTYRNHRQVTVSALTEAQARDMVLQEYLTDEFILEIVPEHGL